MLIYLFVGLILEISYNFTNKIFLYSIFQNSVFFLKWKILQFKKM